MLYILDILEDTTVDGPGFRTSVYCAGCPNRCPGCHNPQSWDMSNGSAKSTAEILEVILADPFADVTFSGGDPMAQAQGFTELAIAIKEQSNKNIWCFTGFLFEDILKKPVQKELLHHIDVLVDSPFIEALKDEQLRFRGSSNQRVIDVPASLATGSVVLVEGM
ncbi:MAG: anaerobic ribonucleoside-triphosphate reductase activating protein [Bacteroidaceae bacterium]|nr:anaerobic ribonucleoside-triphosphate reductase activating protein [Bacteroidaceae bacterium]